MKKMSVYLLVLVMVLGLAACGGRDKKDTTEEAPTKEVPVEEPAVEMVEPTVDATAEALGYSDGVEQMYEMIGAEDGKAFNEGEFEIYKFDVSSEEYKRIEAENSINGIDVAAYKDGIVLIFANEANQEIIDNFNEVVFE